MSEFTYRPYDEQTFEETQKGNNFVILDLAMGQIIKACKKKRLDAYSTDIILKSFDLLVESEVKASDLENAEDELYQ